MGNPNDELIDPQTGIRYALARPEEVPQIMALLEANGLDWPGPAGTPYVAREPEDSSVIGVMFKTLCFHVEPFAAKRSSGVSAGMFARVIEHSFEALANETGHTITVYSSVQNDPRALSAAARAGMENTGLILHQKTIAPDAERVIEAELIEVDGR